MNYHEAQSSSNTDHNFNAYYIGTVEAIDDPKFEGRCKVKVFSLFDDIDIADLPWAIPAAKPTVFGQDARAGSISIPKIGAVVGIKFNNGDIYSPEYSQIQELGEDIKEELQKGNTPETFRKKYEGSHFILFDGDEEIKFWFDREIGLQMELKQSFIRIDNATSNILIEHKDNHSQIGLENTVIRIVADSEVRITGTSKITATSKTAHINSKTTIIGASGVQYSAVLGEPLFAILKTMAATIDAKVPSTAGALASAVDAAKVQVLSRTVTIGT